VTPQVSDDAPNAPVAAHLTIPGWRVALIVASFSIGLPDFLNGANMSLALGLDKAVAAAFLAGLILCLGGCMTALVSVQTRLSTYVLVQRSFGRGGAAVINTVIALIHFCWFGVNAAFFGEAMMMAAQANGLAGNFPLFVILGGLLMTGSTIIGFRALDRLALVCVPVLAAILIAVAVLAVRQHGLVVRPSAHPPEPMEFGVAVSALIGAYMLAVATMPDLARFIRTRAGAVAGMIFSYPIATPLMMVAAALPALATHQTSFMKLVVALGLGTPVLFLLVLPTWTVNSLNLYSASLSLSTTFPAVRQWVLILAGGVIGTAFALMGILDLFVPFVLFLGLIIPPIAAIYVIDAFTTYRGADTTESIRVLAPVRWAALGTWAGSILVAVLAVYKGWTLTTVPALDATLVASLAYGLILWLRARRGLAIT
jgi:cytosine permease